MGKSFADVKGNCDYRITELIGADHCSFHNDDCEAPCCPKMGNSARWTMNYGNELALSQCPMCGSELPCEEIDWSMKRSNFPFLSGMVVGWIGIFGLWAGIYTLIELEIIPVEFMLRAIALVLP